MKNLNYSTFTDYYPAFGTKTVLQVKSLISIVNHTHILDIVENIFNDNSGTKGIIYMDLKHRGSNRLLIAKNTFKRNFGYFSAGLIYIRARGNPTASIYTTIPNDTNIFCTGYHFEKNIFQYNSGCI